jgi:hypothetical protein
MVEFGVTPGFMVGIVYDRDMFFGDSVVVSLGVFYIQFNIGG